MSLDSIKKQFSKFPNEEQQIGFLNAIKYLTEDEKSLKLGQART